MQAYKKLLTGLLAVTIIPLLIYFSVGMVVQEAIIESFQEVGGELLPGNIASTRTISELYQILHLVEQYVVSRDHRDKKKVQKAIANLDVLVATHSLYHGNTHGDVEKHDLNLFLDRFSSFISEYLQVIENDAPQNELLQVKSKIDTSLDLFAAMLNPIIDRELQYSSRKLQGAKQKNIKVFHFFVGFGLLTICIAFLLVFYISRRFRVLDTENENFKNNLESLVQTRTRQLNEKNADLQSEITERRKIESELRDSETNLATVFDSSLPICITSIDFEIMKANHSYCEIWSISETESNNLKCYESRPGPLCHTELCPMQQVMDGKKDVIIEEQKTDKNGLIRDFIVTTKPFYGNTGELIGIAQSYHDVTERIKAETEKKELEKGLRQAQKMEAIGTLAGGIAHDFNNLLMAISGFTQLAMWKVEGNQKIIKDLEQVNVATERATDLVGQILTFSRQTEQVKKPIQVAAVVKEAMKLLRASIPADIEIKQTINSQWNILADSTQIHQILMNLVTNGYHSMMVTGGVLGVSLYEVVIEEKAVISDLEIPPGKYICLEVSDTGCGMDEETKGKIFEPYFSTKEINKGTGLGLAVVHGIVTGHHGYISVYSEPDQGTTFHVYLPMIEEEHVVDEQHVETGPIVGGSERIMLIDDEDILICLTSEVLAIYGYQITSFTNSVKAMQEFSKHPDGYDLIITDMAMPHMTGLQVTQKIKEIRPDLPIILCSGFSKVINEPKALEMGIDSYLHKPVEMENLTRIIRELLDRSQS